MIHCIVDSLRESRACDSLGVRERVSLERRMANEKVVFSAFAIEDVRYRDYLKGPLISTRSPSEPTSKGLTAF